MKIIGAGFSRTGNYSLKVALEKLGYRVYNFFDMLENYENGHLEMWNDFMEGRREMDWQALYEGFDISSDIPSCIYWREQMEAFPDARVILTVRNLEEWWNRWSSVVKSQEQNIINLTHIPRFAAMRRLVKNWERVFFGIEPGRYTAEESMARIRQHNQEVRETVPAKRLLVFHVREGWAPLCQFLGVPVPDEPYPPEDAGTARIEQAIAAIVQKDIQKYGPPPQQPTGEWAHSLALAPVGRTDPV
jgi:hypothetical protein